MRQLRWPLAALLVAALAVGLWAFQPWRAFTSSAVDEAVPTSAEPTGETAQEAGESTPQPRPHTEPEPDPEAASGKDTQQQKQQGQKQRGQKQRDQKQRDQKQQEETEPRDEVLSRTGFENAEHETTGRAAVLRLADGRRFVRLENFDTSDGPDLHVWLSSAPSGGAWGSYDDGRYVRLGELKATSGNQNYAIPKDADLRGMRSVVIWCDRFDVAFGTAPL